MRVRELMTSNPACCTPNTTAADAARLMEQHDCGSIPVIEEDRERKRLIGVVTDRDLAVRVLARGRGGDVPVRDVMSADIVSAHPDEDVKDVAKLMSERQVRRIPIVDDGGALVGLVAQADLARADRGLSDKQVGKVVEDISEPSGGAH